MCGTFCWDQSVKWKMTLMRNFLLLFLLVLVSGYSCETSKRFRFDYEFNEHAGGWLKFHVITLTWEQARMRCHAEGAVLASPLTKQLKAAIISFVNQQRNHDEDEITIFSGVHATFSKGVYSSVEVLCFGSRLGTFFGVPLLRLAVTWARGEPDNYEDSESCLAMHIDDNGTMADTVCGNVLPYVCYKKDTHLVMTKCGTTDPQYKLNDETGSCYKYHKNGLIWSEAYMTCVAEGGHLVIINSKEEAAVVWSIKNSHPESTIHSTYPSVMLIGFRDMSVHQHFMTIHGETLTEAGYDLWGPGNPSNSSEPRIGDFGEHCGSSVATGYLNDVYCHTPVAFLCEMTPKSLI